MVKRIYTPETSPIKKHKKYKSQINNKEIEESAVLTFLSPPTFSIDKSKYYIIKHTQCSKVGQQSLDMGLVNNNNDMM